MKKGFTLAEVLITLLIIGVVAALTIPSVISNYQQQEFKTGLKKAVSVLNETITLNIAQEGETPYENTDILQYLQRHMNVLKRNTLSTCYSVQTGSAVDLAKTGEACYQNETNTRQNSVFYTTDGMRFESIQGSPENHLYLHENGADIYARREIISGPKRCLRTDASDPWNPGCVSWSNNVVKSANGPTALCGSYGLSNNPNNTQTAPCVIMVDVNGDKKPNPPFSFIEPSGERWANGVFKNGANQPFDYTYPTPTDKKLQDVFTIMITDEKAIPFGVVAQRAMYSK